MTSYRTVITDSHPHLDVCVMIRERGSDKTTYVSSVPLRVSERFAADVRDAVHEASEMLLRSLARDLTGA